MPIAGVAQTAVYWCYVGLPKKKSRAYKQQVVISRHEAHAASTTV